MSFKLHVSNVRSKGSWNLVSGWRPSTFSKIQFPNGNILWGYLTFHQSSMKASLHILGLGRYVRPQHHDNCGRWRLDLKLSYNLRPKELRVPYELSDDVLIHQITQTAGKLSPFESSWLSIMNQRIKVWHSSLFLVFSIRIADWWCNSSRSTYLWSAGPVAPRQYRATNDMRRSDAAVPIWSRGLPACGEPDSGPGR